MENTNSATQTILDIHHLTVSFVQYEGRTAKKTELPVISDLNVTIREGEIVAVAGSSGSGKSVLAHAMLGLLPENATAQGDIRYRGQQLTAADMISLRGHKIALVPQSVNYLDPLLKVGTQIMNEKKDEASRAKMQMLCRRYGLGTHVEDLYPFELSGGMARRVLLLTALMNEPELIIADEPTPGMELSLAKQAMADFRRFADEGKGVLLITHDLSLARNVADRIVVFYAGTTVEEANVADFAKEELLRHPYTKMLWRAMPEHGFGAESGTQPYVRDMPAGCPFAPRCSGRMDECAGKIPMYDVRQGRVRCIRYAREENDHET